LARDVRPLLTDSTINFEIQITSDGREALTWMPDSTWSAQVGPLALIEGSDGVAHMLTEGKSALLSPARYTLTVGAAQAIEKAFEATLPSQLEVGVPYPNPAVDQVIIPVRIPQQKESARITLIMYDALGRRVLERAMDHLDAGNHHITIERPNTLASGLYILRLSTDTSHTTSHITFVR